MALHENSRKAHLPYNLPLGAVLSSKNPFGRCFAGCFRTMLFSRNCLVNGDPGIAMFSRAEARRELAKCLDKAVYSLPANRWNQFA